MAPEDSEAAKAAIRQQLDQALPFLMDTSDDWQGVVISQRLFVQSGDRLVYDATAGARLVDRARSGDARADAAIRKHAAQFLREVGSVPAEFAPYIADCLEDRRPKLKRGARQHVEFTAAVRAAVDTILALGLDFAATRSAPIGKPSACSLIAEVFAELGHDMWTEDRVQDALKRPKRRRGVN